VTLRRTRPGREVEDLAALVARAGGSAHVYGYSSGALVAMHAAAHGVPIRRLALLEPPLPEEGSDDAEFTAELAALVRAGRNADAVEHFHRGIGVAAEVLHEMRSTPAWTLMEAVAPTLVYDCLISQATTPQLLRAVDVPTLVLDSQGSTDDLTGWAASVAAQLPRARHRSLAGEWHTVPDDELASALLEFFLE
jgi:pimeloyl-ACP methyl ester carboxylesterase